MQTVTKRQFIDAKKIIRKYIEQQSKGQYQFLYYKKTYSDFNWGYDSEDAQAKYIKAKNIDEACSKMLKWMQSIKTEIEAIDYEVENEGEYIDITDNQDLKEFVG